MRTAMVQSWQQSQAMPGALPMPAASFASPPAQVPLSAPLPAAPRSMQPSSASQLSSHTPASAYLPVAPQPTQPPVARPLSSQAPVSMHDELIKLREQLHREEAAAAEMQSLMRPQNSPEPMLPLNAASVASNAPVTTPHATQYELMHLHAELQREELAASKIQHEFHSMQIP